MITFRMTPDAGDPFEVTATSRDVYLWEKSGRNRTIAQLQDNASMTALYELAHLAAKRAQQFTGSLDDFTSTVDIEPLEQDQGNPTNAGATPAT